MSRHRFLKEFEREAYEELYAEDDQTDVENDPEFQSKLKNAMNELKSIIGDSFDNAEIEETLCYYQLNIKKSIRWLLEGVDPDTQPKKVDVNLKKSTDLKQTTLKPSKQGPPSSTLPFSMNSLSPIPGTLKTSLNPSPIFNSSSPFNSPFSTLKPNIPPPFSSLNLNSLPFARKTPSTLTPSSNTPSPLSDFQRNSDVTSSQLTSSNTRHVTSNLLLTSEKDSQAKHSSFSSPFTSSTVTTSIKPCTSYSFVRLLETPSSPFSQTLISNFDSSSIALSTLMTSVSSSFTSYPFPYLYPSQPETFFHFEIPSPDDKVAAARAKGKTPSSSSTSKPSPASHETKAPQSKSKPPKKNIASSSESKLSTQMTQLKVTDPITNPSPPVLKKSQQELHQAYQLRRAQLNLVVIGHVDAGKSTLLGHFLNLTGHVETKQIQKYEHQATQIGKKSFQYAWVMDENEDERQRGVTMTLGYVRVETQHKVFNFMDAPGHQDWVPHMISGAGMADVACLVVDSSLGAFEKGLEKGQTKEHGLLMKAMGVASVLVLVNKMDRIDWDPTRFHHIQTKITQFLSQLNYNQVTVIPVSGLLGENLIQKSSHVDWYHGPCFLEALDQVKVPERALFQPFRLRVSEKKANWVHGQIDTGSIQVGEPIVVLPHQTSAQVRSIQIEGTSCKFAVAGDQVGIQLTGIDGDVLAPHDVLCAPSSPIAVTDTFECKVVIFDCLVPITPGFPFLLHQGSVNESGHVKALLGLIDKSTGNVLKKGPKCATKGSTVLMEIQLERPICIEHHEISKQFGRFSLRRGGETIGAGIVTKILEPHSSEKETN